MNCCHIGEKSAISVNGAYIKSAMGHSKEELTNELKRVSKKLGKESISRREFQRETGITEGQVLKYFDSYNDFVQYAGYVPTDQSRIPDDTLFDEMHNVFIKEKGIINARRFGKAGNYDYSSYRRRWETNGMKFF